MFGIGVSPRAKRVSDTNLLPHPSPLSNASWWSAVALTTITTGQSDPFAGTGATLLTEPAGSGSYGINPVDATNRATIVAGRAVRALLYAKAGTCSWLRLILSDAATPTVGVAAWFNVSTGAKGTASSFADSPSGIASAITGVGGGWYLCEVTAVLASATRVSVLTRLASADAASSDTGGKTMTVYLPQII